MLQRSRDVVAGPITLDYLVQKAAEGWKVAAIEWVKEVDQTVPSEAIVSLIGEDVPYGLRLSEDGSHLEQHPLERTVLLLILEKIVREKRITEIAADLNAEGLKTRQGNGWTASAVFDLLPRLIEAGPALLKSGDWQTVRSRATH